MLRLAKMVAKAYYRAAGYYPTMIGGLRFKCDPYHISFWRLASRGLWEPHTYRILSRFLNSKTLYLDIGSWIGPTVIYAAKKSGQVVCFEPDIIAYRYLIWNIELNELHNVKPYNIALADRNAIMRMASLGSSLGDSMTSLLNADQKKGAIDVLALTWDKWLNISETKRVDFIKIDIEGGEFALLPTMKDYLLEYRPIVYLSTHAPFIDIGIRKEQMQHIVEVMKIYNTCLNENMDPMPIDRLYGEDAMSNLCSFVFAN